MCNLYSLTRGQEAMRRLFRVTRDSTGNLGLPEMMAPVVRAARDGERELSLMRWRFPPPPIGNAPVINVRNLNRPLGAAGSRRNGAGSCRPRQDSNYPETSGRWQRLNRKR